jgi:hypothetical protein
MIAKRRLFILLWLIAIHSFIVGLILMAAPAEVFQFFGFSDMPGFFSVQAGVFHLVMVVAYMMCAYTLTRELKMIWFCVSAKFIATVYLLIYYFLAESVWVLLVSGILDFLMGLLLWMAFVHYKNSEHV